MEKAKKNLPTREAREKWMRFAYGDAIAEEIMAENPGDFLTEEELVRRVERAKTRFAEIRAELKKLPPFERVDRAMRELGAPLTPAEIRHRRRRAAHLPALREGLPRALHAVQAAGRAGRAGRLPETH